MKTKKNLKEAVSPILKAAALVVVIVALGTCEALGLGSKPAVSFENVSIEGLTFDKANMMAYINVQNDNSIEIPFPEINWALSIADVNPGESFVRGAIQAGTTIAARSSTIAKLPFDVFYLKLYDVVKKLADDDEAPYRIDLDVTFDMPVMGSKTFATKFDGKIPLPKLPEFSFGDIKYKYTIIPPTLEFDMPLLVNNKNAFALNLNKLNYNFKVNNTSWVTSGAPPNQSLSARSPTTIPLTASVSATSLIPEIISMITSGSSPSYTCDGNFSLTPDFPNLTPLEDRPFEFPGIGTFLQK